ncbi:MAG: hypothetical protein ACYTDE_00845 [Planctomycetota bacterium]
MIPIFELGGLEVVLAPLVDDLAGRVDVLDVDPHPAPLRIAGGERVSALIDDPDREFVAFEGELHVAGVPEHLLRSRVGGFATILREAVVVRVDAHRFGDRIEDPGVAAGEGVGADIRSFEERRAGVEPACTADLRGHVTVLAAGDRGVVRERAAEAAVLEHHAALREVAVQPLRVGPLLGHQVGGVVGRMGFAHRVQHALVRLRVEGEDRIAHVMASAAERAVAVERRGDDRDLRSEFVVAVIVRRHVVVGTAPDVEWIHDHGPVAGTRGHQAVRHDLREDRSVRVLDVAGVSHRATRGTDDPVAEIAVDAVHQLLVELRELPVLAFLTVVGGGDVAFEAEGAGLVGILVRDGEPGVEDRVTGGLGHQADHPGVVRRHLEPVVAVAEHAVHRGVDPTEFERIRIRLGAGSLKILERGRKLVLFVTATTLLTHGEGGDDRRCDQGGRCGEHQPRPKLRRMAGESASHAFNCQSVSVKVLDRSRSSTAGTEIARRSVESA